MVCHDCFTSLQSSTAYVFAQSLPFASRIPHDLHGCSPSDFCWHCCSLVDVRRWFYRKLTESFSSRQAAQAWLYAQIPSLWSCVTLALIGHFLKECIENFAQSQASYEHDLQLRAKAHSLKRNQ